MTVEGKVKTETVVTLTLDEGEARWLMDYMQNCMNPGEDRMDTRMRGELFDGIRDALRGDSPGTGTPR